MTTDLTYDSEAASTAQADEGNAGYFGWGWQSTISSSLEINGSQVTANEPNGSEAVFNEISGVDGCNNSSDYEDFQRYTISNSIQAYARRAD